jgi:hypothetical protein
MLVVTLLGATVANVALTQESYKVSSIDEIQKRWEIISKFPQQALVLEWVAYTRWRALCSKPYAPSHGPPHRSSCIRAGSIENGQKPSFAPSGHGDSQGVGFLQTAATGYESRSRTLRSLPF